MKCILLCAGYATRLFPLTKNFPKALLEVGNKKILDYIMEDLNNVKEIDEIFIITNDKYFKHFSSYADTLKQEAKVTVINDYTLSNEDRLGAIGDILYTLKTQNIDDDILVMASDNIYTFSVKDFVDFYKINQTACVTLKEFYDREQLKRFAVTAVDENYKIVDFEEKPENPKHNLAAYAMYIYRKDQLYLFDKYIEEGNNQDAPGNFIEYLYKKQTVKGYIFDGEFYDIGTHASLKEVNEKYKNK